MTTHKTMPINSIHIGDRIRKELGDVSALAKSIEDVGLLHPVVIDRRGHLVAGARRLAALRKLQWTKVPVTVAADLAEALLLMAEGDENVQREPFAPVEAESYQRQLIEMYEPEAKAAKAHGRTAPGKPKNASDKLSQASKEERATKTKAAKATGYSRATLDKVTKVREVAESYEDEDIRAIAQEALTGDLAKRENSKVARAYNKVMKAAKERDAEKQIAEWQNEPITGRIQIHSCSAAELAEQLEPDSVDLIFTDPPYPEEFISTWSDLGALAAKVLKPGGLVVAYTGQLFLPEVMRRMAEHLDYWWCYAIAHDHTFFQLKIRHVQVGWKPLLVYRKPGTNDLREWHKDIVTEGSQEKTEHFDGGKWQQSEIEAAYWVDKLTTPDDLVIDPFIGSGTTGAACKQLGRRFIGCDIKSAAVIESRGRLA